MGLTNFVLTVAGVSAVVLLLRSDVKQSASIFKRNVKHIRHWLEEETSEAAKSVPLFYLSYSFYIICSIERDLAMNHKKMLKNPPYQAMFSLY
ncbi:hypothetical protein PHAVU_009G125500 [Phaseolus vulgaris]|uniref:Uncharacterized protein n=1 Tax=Phaseolus vulgaris TaxID=3885 RepID=V7AXT0_PHAVU|nr:hypothetical protein PHAVU_009G125500g [Phaseolus vulgaris]ESW09413.1 hypothetical protein PHAVU_009G125500g [Phaseolus vulgaris]